MPPLLVDVAPPESVPLGLVDVSPPLNSPVVVAPVLVDTMPPVVVAPPKGVNVVPPTPVDAVPPVAAIAPPSVVADVVLLGLVVTVPPDSPGGFGSASPHPARTNIRTESLRAGVHVGRYKGI